MCDICTRKKFLNCYIYTLYLFNSHCKQTRSLGISEIVWSLLCFPGTALKDKAPLDKICHKWRQQIILISCFNLGWFRLTNWSPNTNIMMDVGDRSSQWYLQYQEPLPTYYNNKYHFFLMMKTINQYSEMWSISLWNE